MSTDLAEATQTARDMATALGPNTHRVQNLAKDIASRLHNKLPVVYGAGFLSGVARRWKTQLNENSKTLSFWEELPEAGHNSVEAFRLHQTVGGQVSVILLHSYFLPPPTTERFQLVEELLVREGIPYRQLDGAGTSPLSHLLSTVLLGDYVSYYLAMLNGVDPSPLPIIEGLKQRLSQGEG
jgi:glucose/mannose-6-phosphate isomerase